MSDESNLAVEFLTNTVKALVSQPNAAVIKQTEDVHGLLLTLQVYKDDMPVVIGKKGRTAEALRTLLRLLSSKLDNKRINLKIVEPDGSERRAEKPVENTVPAASGQVSPSTASPEAASNPAESIITEAPSAAEPKPASDQPTSSTSPEAAPTEKDKKPEPAAASAAFENVI